MTSKKQDAVKEKLPASQPQPDKADPAQSVVKTDNSTNGYLAARRAARRAAVNARKPGRAN